MTVSNRVIEGKKFWVLDLSLRRNDGKLERYRRVAKVQNRAAAKAEERRLEVHFETFDTFAGFGFRRPEPAPEKPKRGIEARWENALEHYRAVVLPKKKPSTRNGYDVMLEGPWMRRWKGRALGSITRIEIEKWDTAMITAGASPSTRRNHQIILRAVLKSVGPIDGEPGVYIQKLPAFPRLPPVGRTTVEAASPEDVALLLREQDDERKQPVWSARRKKARLAFALAALGGLRASEIRGLRRRDVDLPRGLIVVRTARVVGEESTPKSGHEREIPIAADLLPILKTACEGLKSDAYVAVTHDGTPWSDGGLWAAIQRAATRLRIETKKVHALRHYFATALFGGSVDARTVQSLLGHSSLEVTMRYAHTDRNRAREAISSLSI